MGDDLCIYGGKVVTIPRAWVIIFIYRTFLNVRLTSFLINATIKVESPYTDSKTCFLIDAFYF